MKFEGVEPRGRDDCEQGLVLRFCTGVAPKMAKNSQMGTPKLMKYRMYWVWVRCSGFAPELHANDEEFSGGTPISSNIAYIGCRAPWQG